MKAAAWAVLDTEDRVIAVRVERDEADAYVEFTDGVRVAPLGLVDLDAVIDSSPVERTSGGALIIAEVPL